jgi:hypothetical protein
MFLQCCSNGLKLGRTAVFGESGNYWNLTHTVLKISCGMMGERLWTGCMAPLLAGVPLVVLALVVQEVAFRAKMRAPYSSSHRSGGSLGLAKMPVCGEALLLRHRKPGAAPNPQTRAPRHSRDNACNRYHPAASGTPCAYVHNRAYKQTIIPILMNVGMMSRPRRPGNWQAGYRAACPSGRPAS